MEAYSLKTAFHHARVCFGDQGKSYLTCGSFILKSTVGVPRKKLKDEAGYSGYTHLLHPAILFNNTLDMGVASNMRGYIQIHLLHVSVSPISLWFLCLICFSAPFTSGRHPINDQLHGLPTYDVAAPVEGPSCTMWCGDVVECLSFCPLLHNLYTTEIWRVCLCIGIGTGQYILQGQPEIERSHSWVSRRSRGSRFSVDVQRKGAHDSKGDQDL